MSNSQGLVKSVSIDLIEVVPSGHVQVREATVITDDGKEVSKTYHRHVLSPGDDLKNEDPKVQEIAKAAWKSLKPKGKE